MARADSRRTADSSNSTFWPTWPPAPSQQPQTDTMDAQAPNGYAVVEWGRERITIAMPAPEQTLLTLKKMIADKTGIKPEQQTLLWSGFKLKDDSAPLSKYNIYQAQKPVNQKTSISNLMRGFMWTPPPQKRPIRLTLIGSPETSSTVSDQAKAPSTSTPSSSTRLPLPRDEASTVKHIGELKVNGVDKLQERLGQVGTMPNDSKRSQEFAILSESLLQSLLKLDSVDIEPEWQSARTQRKEAVKQVQAALDNLDSVKSEWSQQDSSSQQIR